MKERDRVEIRDKLMGLGKQSMRKNYYVDLRRELDQRIEAQDALKRLNSELEEIVAQRTKELLQMEMQLIQSEKLAALGGLVAGISHEVNTPLGIAVTVASHISQIFVELRQDLDKATVGDANIPVRLEEIQDAMVILESNLRRTVDLMENFKRISVDQHDDYPQTFDYCAYTEGILKSLLPELKKKQVKVALHCDGACLQLGYPGVWSQILVNLVMNSINHGFERASLENNGITIAFAKGLKGITCHYEDNGNGIEEEMLRHLYDPFFTTKRGGGGTGLGMFIVHKLIVDRLGGSIQCASTIGNGVSFEIFIPLIAQL